MVERERKKEGRWEKKREKYREERRESVVERQRKPEIQRKTQRYKENFKKIVCYRDSHSLTQSVSHSIYIYIFKERECEREKYFRDRESER